MFTTYKQSLITFLLAFLTVVMVLVTSIAPALAAEYNCGVYGAGTYQNNICGATTTDSGAGDGLVGTGQAIWFILLGVLLILVGTYVLYRTRKKMKARAVHKVGV